MRRKSRNNPLKFLVLIGIVLVLGVILRNQGNLINPLQSTTMLMNMPSDETDFAIVGERQAPEDNAEITPITINTDAEAPAEAIVAATTGTMTLETFIADLAAAGVDVSAVTATMSAEGRSLENLLSVVNTGRVSVADLAARLQSESAGDTVSATGPDSAALFDLHWEDFGSVLYDLWLILVVTVIVIVLGRPISWLKNRLRRATFA